MWIMLLWTCVYQLSIWLPSFNHSYKCRGLPLWLSWWRICLQCGIPGFDPWVGKIPWRRKRLPTPVFWPEEFHGLYSPWGQKESDTTEQLSLHFKVKVSASNVGNPGFIPGSGRSPGEGKGYPLQYSGLKNSMDCIVHGVTKSWKRLSDFHFHYKPRGRIVMPRVNIIFSFLRNHCTFYTVATPF